MLTTIALTLLSMLCLSLFLVSLQCGWFSFLILWNALAAVAEFIVQAIASLFSSLSE